MYLIEVTSSDQSLSEETNGKEVLCKTVNKLNEMPAWDTCLITPKRIVEGVETTLILENENNTTLVKGTCNIGTYRKFYTGLVDIELFHESVREHLESLSIKVLEDNDKPVMYNTYWEFYIEFKDVQVKTIKEIFHEVNKIGETVRLAALKISAKKQINELKKLLESGF